MSELNTLKHFISEIYFYLLRIKILFAQILVSEMYKNNLNCETFIFLQL